MSNRGDYKSNILFTIILIQESPRFLSEFLIH